MTNSFLRQILFLLTLLLTGCGTLVGPNHSPPKVDLPAQWNSSNKQGSESISRTWWTAFHDAELSRLETLALSASPDMEKAMARVDEARTSLRAFSSARFPTISANGGVTRSRPSTSSQGTDDSQAQEITTYHQQVDLNFELDLWGKIRRSIEASASSTDAVILNGQAVRLRLTTQVAENYLILRGLEEEIALLQKTLRLRNSDVAVTEERQKGGLTNKVDVSRAQTEFAVTKAELTDLKRRHQLSLHTLAALCGQTITDFNVKAQTHRVPSFAPKTPATLLRQRPDIAEAERTVAARCAEIGVAEANRLPSITLNGTLGLESLSLSDLVSSGSRKFSLGPQMNLPIFNAGTLKAKSAQAKARHAQALADYRSTVLIAFKEIEDALTNTQGYATLSSDYEAAVAKAELAAKLSRERYEQGSSSYLEVTDSQRDVLTYQRHLAQSRNQQAIAAVQLAKALGGGGMD